MKKLLRCAALLLFVSPCFAQNLAEAPSLQLGLSGLSFSKGTLDAELIAEIIAEKQREVKTKLVKNMLLKNIGVECGLFYTYIDNTINIITTEKDEKVRAKNLLENTVNLSFVIAYTDYYLRTMAPNSVELTNMRTLAYALEVDTSLIQPHMELEDLTRISYKKESLSEFKIYHSVSDDDFEIHKNNFVGVLLDIFAEVIRQNDALKELGLMRTNYLQNAGATNAYLNLENKGLSKMYALYLERKQKYESGKINNKTTEAWNVYANAPETQCILKLVLLDSMFLGKGDYAAPLREFQAIKNFLKKVSADKNPNDATAVPVASDQLKAYLEKIATTYADFETQLKAGGTDNANNFFYNRNYKIVNAKSGVREAMIYRQTGIDAAYLFKDKNANKEKIALLENVVMKYVTYNYKDSLYSLVSDKRAIADNVFKNGTKKLNLYIKYFGLIKTLATKGKDTAAVFEAMEKTFPNCGDSTSCKTPKCLFDSISNIYAKAQAELKKGVYINDEIKTELVKVNGFLGKVKYVFLNRYEYMAKYEAEIKPSLENLGAYSTQFLVLRDSLFSYLSCIDKTAKKDMHSMGINLNSSFMGLFTRLDEFDKVTTYDLYLNLLSDAGDVFSNEKMRSSINRILSFVRSYIKIERDENHEVVLQLDAEGFIYAIQKMNYNKSRPLEFLFTVGTNTASFWKSFHVNATDSIRNYSFVSEKIGIKYKLWDFAYTNSFNRGETFQYQMYGIPFFPRVNYVKKSPAKEPVLSNIHLIAYGSGLLYNLANVGTTKDFNSPLLGAGIGLTFFNGLDMNLTFGKPVIKTKPILDKSIPAYWNIGFDIQFVEYIDRLNKKRNANQTQKQISKAVISQNKN